MCKINYCFSSTLNSQLHQWTPWWFQCYMRTVVCNWESAQINSSMGFVSHSQFFFNLASFYSPSLALPIHMNLSIALSFLNLASIGSYCHPTWAIAVCMLANNWWLHWVSPIITPKIDSLLSNRNIKIWWLQVDKNE